MDSHLLEFKSMGDDRGQLVALEQTRQIPFKISRVYYIFRTREGVRRGFHAHRNLKQIAVCVSGSCKFDLFDGRDKKAIELDSPTKGLYIGKVIWREMYDFSPDCVLMVLASELYDEADYIRNFEEFLKVAKEFNAPVQEA
jgi:dTDP-4-dehydrorhamnose 3,5-epimerase-like enzyme